MAGGPSFFDRVDRVFDRLDDGIDAVHRVVNRHKITEGKIAATAQPAAPAPASTRKHLALVSSFHIMEVTDATSGAVTFIVSNGRDAKCECATRAMAERILQALERTP